MANGQEYAEHGKVDVPSFMGMRLAMFDAVKKWNQLPLEQRNVENARAVIVEVCASDPFLKAAGTSKIVERFYLDILKNKPDGIVAFFNGISLEKAHKMDEALQSGSIRNLITAASAFSKSAKEHLGIEALTTSYLDFLKKNAESLKDISIKRSPLNTTQAGLLEEYESKFRSADAMDDFVYRWAPSSLLSWLNKTVGIGYPAVAQHLEHFDREKFTQQALAKHNVSNDPEVTAPAVGQEKQRVLGR